MMRRPNRPPLGLFQRLLDRSPLSDRDLGLAIGRSHSTVHRWRTGLSTPSWGDMERVAAVVGREHARLADTLAQVEAALERYKQATRILSGVDSGV